MATLLGIDPPAAALAERIRAAGTSGIPLHIAGGGSKARFGLSTAGEVLSTLDHTGIAYYEPTELVLTARAGTALTEIESTLEAHGQMLGFEPPRFGTAATWGGTIGCGWSGPRRPFAGSARDFVLGCRLIDGRGRILSFGGQVIKNVAGFDLSRLMVGARGTLGLLLEITVKVLPQPVHEVNLAFDLARADALRRMIEWSRTSLPLSGLAYDGRLRVRLAGDERALMAAAARLGGDREDAPGFWESLRDLTHPFFAGDDDLWRVSVPPAAAWAGPDGAWLLDWGGAQRWFRSADADPGEVVAAAGAAGGHARLIASGRKGHSDREAAVSDRALLALHHRLKAVFDPDDLLNRGLLEELF